MLAPLDPHPGEHPQTWQALQEKAFAEMDQLNKELAEINLMLEQSQLEVNRLAQRNSAVTGQLQQVQAQFDSTPRPDIRAAYDAALDAQQRLFVLRGQAEKLHSDRRHLERYQSFLRGILQVLQVEPPRTAAASNQSGGASQTVEMVLQAQEAERQRLSRQMHDEPAQALSNFILQAEIVLRLFDVDPARARQELIELKAAATATFQKVRDFIFELRPMMLDDLGLLPTLNRYLEAVRGQSGLEVRFTNTGLDHRLEPYLEVMIFRSLQELVGNAVRHSQAGQVKVHLDAGERFIRVTVEDDGQGLAQAAGGEPLGLGLALIRDRAEMLGGSLEVDSQPGQGARLTLQVPASRSDVLTQL